MQRFLQLLHEHNFEKFLQVIMTLFYNTVGLLVKYILQCNKVRKPTIQL